jgi:hypothetical protein
MAFSRRQAAFLRDLRSALGTPYVWGGTSLQHGVDCSGLVQRAAELAGIRGVPRTSQEQFAHGTPVSMRALRPGDLIFSNWGSEQGAGHVSVYIGNGHIIEAAGQGIPVRVASINVLNGHILGARRYLAGAGQGLPNVSAFAHQQIQYHAQASQGGNPAAAAAALQAMRPLQVSPVQQPMQAQTAVQNLIASHQPQQTMIPNAAPPQPSLGPSSSALASSLSALHTRLLTAPKASSGAPIKVS